MDQSLTGQRVRKAKVQLTHKDVSFRGLRKCYTGERIPGSVNLTSGEVRETDRYGNFTSLRDKNGCGPKGVSTVRSSNIDVTVENDDDVELTGIYSPSLTEIERLRLQVRLAQLELDRLKQENESSFLEMQSGSDTSSPAEFCVAKGNFGRREGHRFS